MKTFSALLAICAGNSPVLGEFPAQRPVTRSFDVFFDLRVNKRLSKQSRGWWFETLSCPYDVIVMFLYITNVISVYVALECKYIHSLTKIYRIIFSKRLNPREVKSVGIYSMRDESRLVFF